MMLMFYITVVVGAFPLIAYLIVSKEARTRLAAIVPYIWLIFISALYELIATDLLQVNSSLWFKVYGWLDMALLMYYFWKTLGSYKAFFIISIVIYSLALALLLYFGWLPALAVDAVLSVIELVAVYIASILWFRGIFSSVAENSLWDSPDFYIISALIICMSGTIFLFLSANTIYEAHDGNFMEIWTLNIIFNLILRLLIVAGIWKAHLKSVRSYGREPQ